MNEKFENDIGYFIPIFYDTKYIMANRNVIIKT